MQDVQRIPDHFMGHLLANRTRNLYDCYKKLRRRGAFLRDASGIHLVTRHGEVAQIIACPHFAFVGAEVFPGAPPAIKSKLDAAGFLDLLMFGTGARHRQARRILSSLLSFDRIGRIRMAVESKAETLARQLDGGGQIDIIATVASYLPIRTLAELLGFEDDEILSLVAGSRNLAGLLAAAPMAADAMSAGIDEFVRLARWLDRRLGATVDGADHPLADALREASPDVRRAIVCDLAVLLVTGYDTSRAMLGNAAAALISHPEACGALAADPALAGRAAEELIRYDTPGQVVFRHALDDVTIDHYRIGRGEMLALLIGSANRDETAFEQPDRLDFARTRGRPLSFGAGPHVCIGAAIAKIQLIAFLRAFVSCLPRLVVDGAMPQATQHGLVRGHEQLILHSPAYAA